MLFFAVWKLNALGWCWFVQGAYYLSHCWSAVSFWKQHKPKSFHFFCSILHILPLSLRSLWRTEQIFGCCRSKLMCKQLPLIFPKILLQNCCFSCHFFFCPPLVRGILFVVLLQLFWGRKKKKKKQFVGIFFQFYRQIQGMPVCNYSIPRVHRMKGPGDEGWRSPV